MDHTPHGSTSLSYYTFLGSKKSKHIYCTRSSTILEHRYNIHPRCRNSVVVYSKFIRFSTPCQGQRASNDRPHSPPPHALNSCPHGRGGGIASFESSTPFSTVRHREIHGESNEYGLALTNADNVGFYLSLDGEDKGKIWRYRNICVGKQG